MRQCPAVFSQGFQMVSGLSCQLSHMIHVNPRTIRCVVHAFVHCCDLFCLASRLVRDLCRRFLRRPRLGISSSLVVPMASVTPWSLRSICIAGAQDSAQATLHDSPGPVWIRLQFYVFAVKARPSKSRYRIRASRIYGRCLGKS